MVRKKPEKTQKDVCFSLSAKVLFLFMLLKCFPLAPRIMLISYDGFGWGSEDIK